MRFGTSIYYLMSKGYAIYLANNNRTLKVVEFPIRQYAQSQQLMQFVNAHKGGVIACEDLKAAGFGDLTGDLMYPTQPMGKSGRGKLPDDAQITLDDKGIQEIFNRIFAYNCCKAVERINMNRLVRIDYVEDWHKSSVESIEKCILHFYQLADRLKMAFADVPGISFELGEEEAQYANLYYRVLYQGRVFLQLWGKFGGATFLHIIESKIRFPQWEITVTPFEATCQLNGTFKDVHVQKATDDEVVENVTASYNGRTDQYKKVIELANEIFNEDYNEDDLTFDLVRECVMLSEDAERKIVESLLPMPTGEEKKEFFKYTSLETFMKILENETIRMNSVVAMNDTSETDILQNVIRNFKEPLESEADNYVASNTRFITSFSALEDSLPMWTQYGNKGTGVCLVFERGRLFNEKDLLNIKYISKNDDTVEKIGKFQASLRGQNINFHFSLLDKYRNFIKYDFYEAEEESRYLVPQEQGLQWTINSEYTLVAPYIDRHVAIGTPRKKTAQKNEFPFVLKKVILGPAMPNQKYNCWQINYIASKKGLWNFKAETSKIDNFR